MSLAYIIQQFDVIGVYSPKMNVTIDQTFTGSAEITAMFRAAFNQDSITITCFTYERAPDGSSLKLSGTTNLLGMTDAVTTFLASERDGQFFVTLELAVPSGWTFTKSFPDLPGYYDTTEFDDTKRMKPSFLDNLTLGASKFVFTNIAHSSEIDATDFLPGLNFVGELLFLGALIGLTTITGQTGPVRISGPVREYRKQANPLEFLGLRLQASVPLVSTGAIPLKNGRIFIKSTVDEDQIDHTVGVMKGPGIYLLAEVEIGGRTVEIVAKYPGNADPLILSVFGNFDDFDLAGLSALTQTAGGDDLQLALPSDMQSAQGLKLTNFGAGFNLTNPGIDFVVLGLGCKTSWAIVPKNVEISEIGLNFRIGSPFDSKLRSLAIGISGTLALGDTNLTVFGEYPTYRFVGALSAGETIPLVKIVEQFFPKAPELPPMTITDLLFAVDPKERDFVIRCAMGDALAIPVGATEFRIVGIGFVAEYKKSTGITGAFAAEMTIAGATAILAGELGDSFTLSGSFRNFDLKKFWSLVTNGESLPNEIPDIIFQTISVSVTPKTGAFSLNGNVTVAWDHLTNNGSLSTNVQFSFTHTKAGDKHVIAASISLQGVGPVNVAPGFSIETFNILFRYATSTGWSLGGGLGVGIFDTRLDLQAGYEKTAEGQKFKCRATASPAKQLIGLDGVGSYSFQQFDLLLDRRLVGDKRKTFFDLRLASRLQIDKLFAIDGYLGIFDSAEGKSGLVFKPNAGTAGFNIDFPSGAGMGVKADLFEVGFVKESDTAPWSFSGTVNLGFHDFPAFLGNALPSKVTAKFVASKNLVRISALNVTDPIGIPLPKTNGKDLGKAVVQLTELGIEIKPQLGLVIEAGLGLPAELNTYLGAQIFRVYQQGNAATLARTRFTIAGTGVTIQFLGSPFAGANAIAINGESWFDVDLGEYGALRLKMPTFIYDGVTQYFEAGGGVQITRTLALPLAPLRMFLEAVGAKEMADIFPKKIPIDGLVLVDSNNDLKVDEFVKFLQKAGDVPNDVTKVLKQTGKLINRFPDGFKEYFNLQVPDSLEFKFGFSPAGRISIGLLAPKKPVRVLFPSVVQSYVPMPGLCGIEVRKFSVGTLLAGSLLYGEIDATIDQFDLPSLVVSLALPSDPSFPLPTSDQLQRRIILDDVFCIVPISAGVPIPIPLFYDEIGLQYLGVEGIGLQAHVAFPKPNLGAEQATAIFQALSDFTSDPKKLLDPKTPPGGVDLAFSFHDEYLQAPEYLGGKLLGTRGKTTKVGTWKNVASMMNFCKTFSVNDCIQAIPIEQRVGSAEYRFAFMKFDADWMLTTPAEFKSGAYQRMKLSQSDIDDFIAVLPSVAATAGSQVKGNEEGLVSFVRGQADLGFLRLDAALGLAASGSMGFATGFKFEGAIGKIVLELQGAVMVNAPYATSTPAITTQVAPSDNFKPKSAGKALSLDGKSAWIEIPASDSLVLPEYTIELWLRSAKDQTGEWVEVFGEDSLQGGNQRNHYLEINTKKAFYHHRFKDAKSGNSGAPNTPDGSVIWDKWQHVVLTNDGTTAKTFIDGKEVASGPVNGDLVLLKESIFIGKVPGAGTSKFWKGEIAEVRIWKSVRDDDDIQEFMREVLQGDEKDLVSCYQFDSDSGDKAVDICGRNHGTIKNGKFVDCDLLRFDGLEFDGKSSYIEVPDSESLRIGPYTVEAWVKPYTPQEKLGEVTTKRVKVAGKTVVVPVTTTNSRPPWEGVFGKAGRNYTMIIHRNGFVHHRFHTSKSANDGAPNTADNVIQWNDWNHIVITNDGKMARTYLNGAQVAEGPVEGNKLIVDNGTIVMGRSPDAAAETFAGEIAEVRLWSGARTLDEINANAVKRIGANTTNLVGLWRMGDVDGDTLVDTCGRNHGRLFVKPKKNANTVTSNQSASSDMEADWALVAKAPAAKKAAIQVVGHTQLDVLGHRAMSGDLRIVDSTFWFSGALDLFPRDWPIRVYGHVEGLFSKQRFFLAGEAKTKLFGMTLAQSRLFVSNEQIRLDGKWLGLYTLLDVSWEKDNPVFAGSIGFHQTPTIDFGAIRMGGVKVADNVRLSFDIGADISVRVSRAGFSANVRATFTINGKGFDVSFGISVAPDSIGDLVNWIKNKIIEAPLKYLAHLFTDAATWMKNIGDDTIEFAKDVGEAVGGALKSAFKVPAKDAAALMKSSGYAAHQVGAALGKAYNSAASDVAVVLKGAGYAAEDVGHALQSEFSHSAEDAAKVLKNVGFPVGDVSKALESVFGKSVDDCEKLLKGAGFDSKDVSNALKTVDNAGKSIEKGVVSTAKKLKFW